MRGRGYTLSGHHPNHRAQRDNNKKVWQFDFSDIDERIIAKRSENCNSPPITMCHRPFSFCVVPFPSFSCGPVFFFVAFNYQAGRVISRGGGGVHTPATDPQLPPEYKTSADLQAGAR